MRNESFRSHCCGRAVRQGQDSAIHTLRLKTIIRVHRHEEKERVKVSALLRLNSVDICISRRHSLINKHEGHRMLRDISREMGRPFRLVL
jgi:hypothetical protein